MDDGGADGKGLRNFAQMSHIQQQHIHRIPWKPVTVWQTEKGFVSGCRRMNATMDNF